MKATCLGWFPVLLGCLLFAACSEEDIVKNDNVPEGYPISLKFTLTVPQLQEVDVTRASDAVETQLQQLALFFYKQSDTSRPFFVKEIDNFGNGPLTGMGSSTNYFYEIEIPQDEGLTSGNYKLYAIANWQNAFCNIDLDECRDLSLEDLKSKIISRAAGNNTLDLIGYTPMSGKYGPKDGDGEIALQPGENSFEGTDELIRLRRAVAKVTFEFKTNEGITFKPESYSIYNFSQSSTLVDRTGWDGTEGTKPGNLQYQGNGTFSDFKDLKFSAATPNSFTFYMLENVQHAKKTTDQPKLTKALREKRELTEDNKRGGFVYAPDNSTYVVVNGQYDGPGQDGQSSATGTVSYTIQLGDFNETRGGVDNFTIRRNVKYKYTVTVAGVNNIITEAQAEDADGETQPGAEGDIIAMGKNAISIPLDAHYEKVLLRIPASVLKNPMFYVSTPFSRTVTGIQPGDANAVITDDSKDCNWIHFVRPKENSDGAITFGIYNENNVVNFVNIFDLLKELKNIQSNAQDNSEDATDHYIVRNGYVYTTAYVDEYFYTENPNGGSVSLSDFVNKPDRVMNICTTKSISLDGNSSYVAETIISFSQNAIYTIYPLTGVDNPFGIEKTNEWGPIVRGNSAATNLSTDAGWTNTQQLLLKAKETNFSINNVGYIFSDGANTPTFYYPENDDKCSYIAALSRNRDENGNGKIDDDELKWYIPARDQCVALWMGDNDLGEYRPYNATGLESKTGWSQVEGPDGLLHTSSSGTNAVWWNIEGSAFGPEKNSAFDMRCIRNLNEDSYQKVPTKFSSYENNIISISGLSNNNIRTTQMTGEYTAEHTERQNDNLLPRAFEVAKEDLTVTIGGNAGDDYAPKVTITKQDYTTENSWIGSVRVYYNHTITLHITREAEHKYYVGTSTNFSRATEITTDSYDGKVQAYVGDYLGYHIETSLYIFSENGNYVRVSPTRIKNENNYTYLVEVSDPVTVDKNKPVSGTPTSTFTLDQIQALVNLAAANYTQEPDGSDKGQWRVPNQRELTLMDIYFDKIPLNGNDYTSCTFFTAKEVTNDIDTDTSKHKKNPFHICYNKNNRYITLNYQTITFYIRPVRDVVYTPQQNNDNTYQSGGNVIR